MAGPTCAVILAAGAGRRMGADKGLLDLGGTTAIERVVATCERAGANDIVVVRAAGQQPLPRGIGGRVVTALAPAGEMIDSLRAGVGRCARASAVLVFPVDYAMVGAEAAGLVLDHLGDGAVALPLWRERPGHPIALAPAAVAEVLDPGTVSLRAVVTADRARVRAVQVNDPWVCRDLDTPEDLLRAREWLAERRGS